MLAQALPAVILLAFGTLIVTLAFLLTPNVRVEKDRRINLVAGEAAKEGGNTNARTNAPAKSAASKFDAQVRSVFSVGAKSTWGMQIGAIKLLLAAVVAGAGTCVLVHRLGGFSWLLAAIAGAAAAFLVPRAILLKQQGRAESRFMDLFPDAVDTIVRMLRAGLPMTSAVRVVSVEAAAPVSTVFGIIADQIKIGIPLETSLETSSRQIGLDDFRFFAVALLLQYSTGGNVAQTLDMLAGIIRKRRTVRMKARSATSEIRMTAYVLGALPFMTIGALLCIQPNYLTPMFNDPRGHVILAMAGGGLLLSFITMRQMMRSVTKA